MPYVDYLVSNEDVEAPKPSPHGYIKAMRQFGLEPHECVIIEDAPRGLEAARASDCPNIWHVEGVDDVHVKGFRQFMKEIQHGT
jgi:HAD superfamily hydrolase (TIGR01509 family)